MIFIQNKLLRDVECDKFDKVSKELSDNIGYRNDYHLKYFFHHYIRNIVYNISNNMFKDQRIVRI